MNPTLSIFFKTTTLALLLTALAAPGRQAAAQDPVPPGPPPPQERHGRQGGQAGQERMDRVEQIERLKQMRMIEALDLGEEEAVRFMAKRKEHEDRIRSLADERGSILDDLQDEVGPVHATHGSKTDPKAPGDAQGTPPPKSGEQVDAVAVDKDISRILEQDRKMFDERKRYQDEMRKLLGAEKFAKMLLFERDFQMQVRDAVGRSAKRRDRKFDE